MSEEAKVSSVVGQPVTRVDGKLKVTGRAPYGVEHDIPNVAYGVGVASTIGKMPVIVTALTPGTRPVIDSIELHTIPGPASRIDVLTKARKLVAGQQERSAQLGHAEVGSVEHPPWEPHGVSSPVERLDELAQELLVPADRQALDVLEGEGAGVEL